MPPQRVATPGRRVPQQGLPDLGALMARAAEMQEALATQQQALAGETFEGSAGGGMVTAVVTGSGDLVSVAIGPAVLDPDDPELVGDLVVAAVSAATAAMREAAAALLEGSGLAEGIDLGSMGAGGGGGFSR